MNETQQSAILLTADWPQSPATEPRGGAEVQFSLGPLELHYASRSLWNFCPMADRLQPCVKKMQPSKVQGRKVRKIKIKLN